MVSKSQNEKSVVKTKAYSYCAGKKIPSALIAQMVLNKI